MHKFIISFALIFLFSHSSFACSSCAIQDEAGPYFFKMIVFMTALPVICVGAFVYYLKKDREKHDSNEQ